MINIELDIFSGLPNPHWNLTEKEEKELIDRVIAEPDLTAPPQTVGGLGYRGFIVSACGDSREKLMKEGLPSLFYVNAKKNQDLQKSFVNTKKAQRETSIDVLQQADDSIRLAKESIEEISKAWFDYWATHTDSITRWNDNLSANETLNLSLENVESVSLKDENLNDSSFVPEVCGSVIVDPFQQNLSWWNSAAFLCRNNCYNFATRWRQNYVICGKAQPGFRSTRTTASSMNCSEIRTRSFFDGLRETCFTGYQNYVALVIAPNQDYHWYRLCSNGIWCHKPGHTPAKNTDDSGLLITNPQTCNRGIYTQFCGYMYSPFGLSVASPFGGNCGC